MPIPRRFDPPKVFAPPLIGGNEKDVFHGLAHINPRSPWPLIPAISSLKLVRMWRPAPVQKLRSRRRNNHTTGQSLRHNDYCKRPGAGLVAHQSRSRGPRRRALSRGCRVRVPSRRQIPGPCSILRNAGSRRSRLRRRLVRISTSPNLVGIFPKFGGGTSHCSTCGALPRA